MPFSPDEPRPGLSPALQARPLLFGLALSGVLVAVLASALWLDYREKIQSAQARVASVALGSERVIKLQMRNLERALHGIALDARHLDDAPAEQARTLRLAMVDGVDQRHAELRGVVLVDADGVPLDASAGGDRDIGRWAIDPRNRRHAGGLSIGPPRRRADGGWLVPLAVPAPLAGQARPGWVLAQMPLEPLGSFTRGLGIGHDGVANIFHSRGTMLARSREVAQGIGDDFADSPLIRDLLPVAAQGSSDLVSPVDGVRRLLAYRALPDYPLVVVAGLSRDEVLGTWYAFALAAGLVCIAYLLGWLLLARTLWRANRRQAHLVARLAASREILLEAQHIAGLGSFRVDLATGRAEFSPEALSIYGFAPDADPLDLAAILGRTHPEDIAYLTAAHAQHRRERKLPDTRFRVRRPDGSVRTVVARGKFSDGSEEVVGTLQDISDLAEAHLRLHEAESQYRLLFDLNPLPFWVFHRENFRILEANQATEAQYGYSRDELLSMQLRDLRLPEDVAEAERVAGEPHPERRRGRIWRHRCKDGRLLQVAVHSSDISFRGEPARLVLALDVTERLQAQQRLEDSERRFQLVARATSDAVFDWNVVTGVSWRSQSFDTLFGYGPEEMPETIDAWRDRVHPDDIARVDAGLRRSFNESLDREWSAHYRFRRGDGSYTHVHDRGLIERDAEGRVLRMVGGMVDVSRKHQDEAELRLLRRAIESTENGVAVVDARAEGMPLVYVNAAFERITGYPAPQVLGRGTEFLHGRDEAQPGLVEVHRALSGGHEASVLLRNYRRDGELFYNQLSLSPVRDDNGQLTHFVGVLNDVSERQRHEAELAFQASHDELTGLLNRSALLATIEQAIAAHPGSSFTVLYLDVNNFKLINDSLGHEVGDQVLRILAARLRERVGADRIGRMGGNEFMLMLAGDDAGLVDTLLASLRQPIDALSTLHYLSLNAGVARYPEHGASPDLLLRNAGLATHEARRRGHNQRVEYTAQFDRAVTDRQHLVSQLHEALEREQFELHFQTLYDTAREPVGMEALVRWRHPERGLVAPGQFIPAAEDSGLIVPLGRWVLREACRYHRLLVDAGWGHLTIAVNVSAMQFLSGELQHDVPALLEEFGVAHGVLELELTESLVMENPESVIEVMRELRRHGVLLSIDDFGTGYSSMSYLHRLPVDKLKIDRSFVNGVEADAHNAAICDSILALARSFDLKVIAEGVETQAQFDWLRGRDCDQVQGFLLARPLPFSDVVAALTMAHGCIAPAR